MRLCTVEGCGAKHQAKGLCHKHVEKLRRSGTLEYRQYPTECSRLPCKRPVAAKGLCNTHYQKLRRTGTFDRFREFRPGFNKADWHRFKRYGVTPEDYSKSLRDQEQACAICKNPLPTNPKDVHQDHDHATGVARGVLCRRCNIALGHIEFLGIPGAWFDDYLADWALYQEKGA